MYKAIFKIFLTILLLVSILPAFGEEGVGYTAEQLSWKCLADDKTIEANLGLIECVMYLNGVMDGLRMMLAVNPAKFFCPPDQGTSGGQKRLVYLKYLEKHPEHLHRTARVVVLAAFAEAFPCTE